MNNDQAKNLRALMNKTKPKEEHRDEGNVYVFVGEEGSGNTTVVSNLANLLGKDGKKVLIIDFNSGLLTTDIFFNIVPNHSLDRILGENSEKEMLTKAKDNIYVVYASKLSDSSDDEKEVFRQKLAKVRAEVDIVIMDIQGVECLEKLHFVLGSSRVVYVSTPGLEGIKEAYCAIKYLNANMGLSEIGIITNKAKDIEDSDRFFEQLKSTTDRFLEADIDRLGYICKEDIIKDSIKRQTLFTDTYPDSKSTYEVLAIKEQFSN